MLASTIGERELVEFIQRRRALAIKLAFPALIALPLLFSRAPLIYAASALTMLAAFTSAFGSAAVLSRERVAGLICRYRLLPVRPGRMLLERLSTSAGIDFIQMLPVIVMVGIRHPGGASWWPALVLGSAAVLLAGNLLGAVVSTLSDSPGEVMLFVLIPLLPAFYLSGLFTPPQGPLLTVIAQLLPFSYLHEALLGSLGLESPLTAWEAALGAAGFVVGILGLTGLLGRRVLESDPQ